MKNTIVIIGGSFNPPTKAHVGMAELFKDKVNADLVILVPAKVSYMKYWKKYQLNDILPEEDRIAALRSLESDWLQVDMCEVDGMVPGASYDTIQYIKTKYNTSNVYFGIGSDKLHEIPRWNNSKKIVSEEKFILLSRDGDDSELVFNENQLLRNHQDNFIICEKKGEVLDGISSTQAREFIRQRNFKSLESIVPGSVFAILSNNITNIDT